MSPEGGANFSETKSGAAQAVAALPTTDALSARQAPSALAQNQVVPLLGALYSCRGRPMRMAGSEIISCQCATHPTVRAMANITVNIERGMPSAPRSIGTEIHIRVHDAMHNQEFMDRYNRAFVLPDAGEHTLTIPLEAIKHGPAARELDPSAVRGVIIFQEGTRDAPRFTVGEVRLVH